MKSGRALILALALVAASTTGAMAHRLKLFASVAGHEVSGYGFFVGGGRPVGVPIVARDDAGAEIWRGVTGDDGGFAFTVTAPKTLTLTLDAGDGHAATETLAADRFGAAPPPDTAANPDPVALPTSAQAEPPAAARDDAALAARLAAAVAAEVDKAVARQIRPLLEAQSAAEARVRFNDILGGLGWIAGLVGVGLTVAHRRRR